MVSKEETVRITAALLNAGEDPVAVERIPPHNIVKMRLAVWIPNRHRILQYLSYCITIPLGRIFLVHFQAVSCLGSDSCTLPLWCIVIYPKA